MTLLVIFLVCAIGSIVPGLGTEVILLGAALTVGPIGAAGLVLVATIAQVAGKMVVYAAAATGSAAFGSRDRLCAGWRDRIEQSRAVAIGVVFVSALSSMPPLYVTTIAVGATRLGPTRFGLAAAMGRLLRYSAIVAVPRLFLGGLS